LELNKTCFYQFESVPLIVINCC